ncbi:hypothetical protein NEOLEDRAFT_1027551, partial [Neolentinus lepideus HHB14362 ss-1]
DNFILTTRHPSGQQTETSVLNLWKRWIPGALTSGIVPDIIIDANHLIAYLKYAATQKLLTTKGLEHNLKQRLSASSLKKIMTMLGHVRCHQVDTDPSLEQTRPIDSSRTRDFYKALMVQAQRFRLEEENFDITRNTILDSQLSSAHFEEIKHAVLHMNQTPSIVKAFFSWNW